MNSENLVKVKIPKNIDFQTRLRPWIAVGETIVVVVVPLRIRLLPKFIFKAKIVLSSYFPRHSFNVQDLALIHIVAFSYFIPCSNVECVENSS